jgi:hypothetical protein
MARHWIIMAAAANRLNDKRAKPRPVLLTGGENNAGKIRQILRRKQ